MDSEDARVVMTLTAKNGDRLELVTYEGGACGLLRNGRPIPELRWDPCQMDRCTAELLRLAGLQ